jgi:hypothetical protein
MATILFTVQNTKTALSPEGNRAEEKWQNRAGFEERRVI